MPQPPTGSAAATRERILAAASALLEREGSAAITLRGVAKAAEITPMAIYHHFPELADLRAALADREILHFVEIIQAEPRRRTHLERFIHSGDAYVRFALRLPKTFLFLFGETRPGSRQYPRDFRAGQSPSLTLLADMVREAMRDGFLKRADVWDLTFHLWAHTHGYVMFYLTGKISLPPRQFLQLIHRSNRQLIHGLKK
jgi:AcrR family transcriptional regulator